jgi:hypothetical protein
MAPGRGIGDTVLSAAVYAIDACAHHKNKLPEVIAALGANVNHGILISLFRDTTRRLTGGGDPAKVESVLFEVVDAQMGLISYVATSPPYSHHIIGAGIIPLLLEIPKTTVERRDSVSEIPISWLTVSTSLVLLASSMPSSSPRRMRSQRSVMPMVSTPSLGL